MQAFLVNVLVGWLFGDFHSKLFFNKIKSGSNGFVHVVILVASQAACEHHIALFGRKLLIFGIQRFVSRIVYRVIRLVSRLPVGGVFSS